MSQQAKNYGRTSLVVPLEERKKLERLARELGYLQLRGAGAGTLGNISALICAIAHGELKIVTAGQKKDR